MDMMAPKTPSTDRDAQGTDPSMQDIPASIRSILSEDEEKAPVSATTLPSMTPAAEPAPKGAATSMSQLIRSITHHRIAAVKRNGPTLEDLVRDEVRPLLQEWLEVGIPFTHVASRLGLAGWLVGWLRRSDGAAPALGQRLAGRA